MSYKWEKRKRMKELRICEKKEYIFNIADEILITRTRAIVYEFEASEKSIDNITEDFPSRIAWSPRSPDLNPCDLLCRVLWQILCGHKTRFRLQNLNITGHWGAKWNLVRQNWKLTFAENTRRSNFSVFWNNCLKTLLVALTLIYC